MKKEYKITLAACYTGYFVEAITVNLLAVIFIPLREQFGLTYAQFGTFVFVNFIAELLVSILFSKALDRVGTRPFLAPSLCVCIAGFILFALTPTLFPSNIYAGFMVSVFLFATAGGFMELCLSPIVDAIPSDAADSSKALAFLHSFYAWGQVAVVLFTTMLLYFGVSWRLIVILWTLVPATTIVLFARAPIAERATGDQAMAIGKLFRTRIFGLALFAIACGGASEIIIAQYASSFLEKGLGMAKLTGDILGLCGFAVFLAIGRMLYGLLGNKLNIHIALCGGSAMLVAAYLIIVFSPAGAPSVAAIALCGLFVSLMWPGTLAVASKGLPNAGASMFALLAASGCLGCALGPWISGVVTDFSMRIPPAWTTLGAEQFGLRAGVLAGALFPLASLVLQAALMKASCNKK